MTWWELFAMHLVEALDARQRRVRLARDLQRLAARAPRRARRVADAIDVSPRALLPPARP